MPTLSSSINPKLVQDEEKKVSVCVCVHVCICACVHVCVFRSEDKLRGIPRETVHFLCEARCLSETWGSLIRLSWLTREFQRSSTSLVLGLHKYIQHNWPFIRVLGTELCSSGLQGNHLTDSVTALGQV